MKSYHLFLSLALSALIAGNIFAQNSSVYELEVGECSLGDYFRSAECNSRSHSRVLWQLLPVELEVQSFDGDGFLGREVLRFPETNGKVLCYDSVRDLVKRLESEQKRCIAVRKRLLK